MDDLGVRHGMGKGSSKMMVNECGFDDKFIKILQSQKLDG